MSGSLVPTTELEAVNDMLSIISEDPVATIDESQPDAQLAYRLLLQESRSVQAMGWHWNTDRDLNLLPSTAGEFVLPANALSVDTSGRSAYLDLASREGKLYDTQHATFKVVADSVYVDVVLMLDYETLPQLARDYIKIRAGRKFLARTMGTQDTVGYAAHDEKDAKASLEVDEEANSDRTIFQNPDYARLMQSRRPYLWP